MPTSQPESIDLVDTSPYPDVVCHVSSHDPLGFAESVKPILERLGSETLCFVAALLLVDPDAATLGPSTESICADSCDPSARDRHVEQRGQIVLYCARPVEPLFLEAVQQKLLTDYQLSTGTALTEPGIAVTVYGDAMPGPYEPLRSLLTVPVLHDGHASGILAVASVFSSAFSSQDLCRLAVLARQVSVTASCRLCAHEPGRIPCAALSCQERDRAIEDGSVLAFAGPELGSLRDPLSEMRGECEVRPRKRRRVDAHLQSMLALIESWRGQSEVELPTGLRQDLATIAQSALNIQRLLAR